MTDQTNDNESPDGYDGDALMAAMNGALAYASRVNFVVR